MRFCIFHSKPAMKLKFYITTKKYLMVYYQCRTIAVSTFITNYTFKECVFALFWHFWENLYRVRFWNFHPKPAMKLKFYITTKDYLILYYQGLQNCSIYIYNNTFKGVRFCTFHLKPAMKLKYYITTQNYLILYYQGRTIDVSTFKTHYTFKECVFALFLTFLRMINLLIYIHVVSLWQNNINI